MTCHYWFLPDLSFIYAPPNIWKKSRPTRIHSGPLFSRLTERYRTLPERQACSVSSRDGAPALRTHSGYTTAITERHDYKPLSLVPPLESRGVALNANNCGVQRGGKQERKGERPAICHFTTAPTLSIRYTFVAYRQEYQDGLNRRRGCSI